MEKTDVLPERNKNTNLEKRQKKLKENGRLRRMKKRNKN
jgi:hypothetical protein